MNQDQQPLVDLVASIVHPLVVVLITLTLLRESGIGLSHMQCRTCGVRSYCKHPTTSNYLAYDVKGDDLPGLCHNCAEGP